MGATFHLLRIFSFTCFTRITGKCPTDCFRSVGGDGEWATPRILQRGNTFYLNATEWRTASIYWTLPLCQGSQCFMHSVPGRSCILCDSYYCSSHFTAGKPPWETADNLLKVSQLADGRAGPSWPRAKALLLRIMLCVTCHCSGYSLRWVSCGPHIFPQFLQDREVAELTTIPEANKLSSMDRKLADGDLH